MNYSTSFFILPVVSYRIVSYRIKSYLNSKSKLLLYHITLTVH